MKALRVAFLMLLALLLPIRGAVAGAMLCPEGSSSAAAKETSAYAGHEHGPAHQHDEQPGSESHASGCNVCATFCSMTPMPSAMPMLVPSMHASTVTYPALLAAAATFHSDGQERPPRSS